MARCFGLDVAAPRGQDARTRLVKLSMDLHVATSTLYKWREDAVDLTLYGAIEAGRAAGPMASLGCSRTPRGRRRAARRDRPHGERGRGAGIGRMGNAGGGAQEKAGGRQG